MRFTAVIAVLAFSVNGAFASIWPLPKESTNGTDLVGVVSVKREMT